MKNSIKCMNGYHQKNDDINATTSQHKMLCPYPKKGKKKS